MSRSISATLGRCGLAVLSVLVALLLKLAAEPLVEVDVPFVLFLGGILITAWFGGFYPGIAASMLAASIFALGWDASVRDLPAVQRWVRALAFCGEGALVTLLVVLLQRLWARNKRQSEEELSRRKDEFLAMLSHELHSPLAPIVNSLQLLRLADIRDPTFAAARDVLDRQVHHLARLVDGLLDVFSIMHYQVSLQREPLDLADLVRPVAAEFRRAARDNGIGLDVEAAGPVWVDGDRARLRQVLVNLLQNAVKFSNGGDRISVQVAPDSEQQRAAVTVRDTGAGLPRELMGELFGAFGQGRQPMDRRLGGMGLGLALVKGVVELHGGEVHAASAGPGRGSEFGFWIPLAGEPVRPTETTTNAPPPAHANANGHHLRLLIVEDNEDTAASLQVLLKCFGHDVQVAHDGRDGVRLAKRWHPDVVLCDLGLPEMDGYEVASSLRHDPDTADARLIAISGYGRDEDRRRAQEVGFDLHLTKPVDPLQLRQLLNVLR